MFNYTTQSPLQQTNSPPQNATPGVAEEETNPKIESIDESMKEEEEENINRSALYASLLAPRETGFRRYMPKRRMPEEKTHPRVRSIDDCIIHEEKKEEEEEANNYYPIHSSAWSWYLFPPAPGFVSL